MQSYKGPHKPHCLLIAKVGGLLLATEKPYILPVICCRQACLSMNSKDASNRGASHAVLHNLVSHKNCEVPNTLAACAVHQRKQNMTLLEQVRYTVFSSNQMGCRGHDSACTPTVSMPWQNKQALTSTMNSLHKRGHVTPAFLMSWRYSKLPWKYLRSVRTLRQAAPPSSYALAICNSPYCAGGHPACLDMPHSCVVPAKLTSKAWGSDHRLISREYRSGLG